MEDNGLNDKRTLIFRPVMQFSDTVVVVVVGRLKDGDFIYLSCAVGMWQASENDRFELSLSEDRVPIKECLKCHRVRQLRHRAGWQQEK